MKYKHVLYQEGGRVLILIMHGMYLNLYLVPIQITQKVKLVWTIDIENYVNGTNNTAQKLYINNTEYDCLTTTESVSAYNGLISNGHYGTGNYLYANNSANVYTNIYLSSFRGNWDGHGNSQNGLPDIESLEYLRVFDRIVEPHEWDTDGMYPLIQFLNIILMI